MNGIRPFPPHALVEQGIFICGTVFVSGSTTSGGAPNHPNVNKPGITHNITGTFISSSAAAGSTLANTLASASIGINYLASGTLEILVKERFNKLIDCQYTLQSYQNYWTWGVQHTAQTVCSGSDGRPRLQFYLLSGSTTANPVPADPTGSLAIHVEALFSNSKL